MTSLLHSITSQRITLTGYPRFLPILIICLICVVTPTRLSATGIESDQHLLGIYYYTLAENLFKTKELPGNLELALNYYKHAADISTVNREIDWKITRCYWVLATKAETGSKRETYFREGIRYGKRAVQVNPENSNAHTWLALITGSSAMDQGVVKTLYNRESIKSGLETALTLNPENTNALVGLASWYFHVPTLLGGDKKLAMELIEQALKVEPNYTSARLVKAEFLIAEKHFAEAANSLERILAETNPAIRGDAVENKQKAKHLLRRIKPSGNVINPSGPL